MEEASAEEARSRIRKERESFVILQHVYTVSDANPREALAYERLRTDLGFPAPGFRELVDHLVEVGCLAPVGSGSLLSLTAGGAEYIERLAWRRRSVRATTPSPSAPPA